MELLLKRHIKGVNDCIGHLFCNGKPVCDTLENMQYIIPAGRYKVTQHHSAHFKAVRPMLNNVPGRQYILIHEGNYYTDSRGCILVGQYLTKNAFVHSKDNLQKVMSLVSVAWENHEDVHITIEG